MHTTGEAAACLSTIASDENAAVVDDESSSELGAEVSGKQQDAESWNKPVRLESTHLKDSVIVHLPQLRRCSRRRLGRQGVDGRDGNRSRPVLQRSDKSLHAIRVSFRLPCHQQRKQPTRFKDGPESLSS